MKYLLKNINKNNINTVYINSLKKKKIIVSKSFSKFGSVSYKTRLSRSRVFSKKLGTIKRNRSTYFSKNRHLKSVISNIKMIMFSTENGFFLELVLVGLGFKVIKMRMQNMLSFDLHFSHKLYYTLPKNVSIHIIKKKVFLFGIYKSQIVDIAEQIKALRYPNVYKNKGIKYFDEIIKLKPGKQR